MKRTLKPRGFSLIEMMVAVAVFAVVMTVALGALLSMSESDRKAQTLKSVINNLNFALDSMSRSIRTGTTYHCGLVSSENMAIAQDCDTPSPISLLAFLPAGALSNTTVYKLETADASLCGQPAGKVSCIVRSTAGGASGTFAAITAPEVYIDTLNFFVKGSSPTDALQPKVTILMSGTVSVSGTQTSAFNLQTSVTQRLYDR